MLLDQFAMLREIEPEHGLSPEELFSAMERLCNASEILEKIRNAMGEGTFDQSIPQMLEEAWNEVNQCRVYTEKILFIEELLVPTLGEINDAKTMFESLVAWDLGMTQAGFRNIMGCVDSAISGIRPCLEELANWEQRTEGEEAEGADPQY